MISVPSSIVMSVAMTAAVAAAQSDAGLVSRGENVYAEQKCAVCHSIAGKGNQKGPLDDVGSRLSAEEIRLWIVDPVAMTAKTKAARKPAMRAYPNIAKDDLEALIAYLRSVRKK